MDFIKDRIDYVICNAYHHLYGICDDTSELPILQIQEKIMRTIINQ